jgi:hypothetical protein
VNRIKADYIKSDGLIKQGISKEGRGGRQGERRTEMSLYQVLQKFNFTKFYGKDSA